MTENTPESNKKMILGGLIGILAGLWGIVVTLIFAYSQIQMVSSGTPVNVVLRSQGVGFLYLALHLTAFVFLTFVAYSAIRAELYGSRWSKLFIPVSIVLIGLSLIPGSSIGMLVLPSAVGLLIGGLLFRLSVNWQHRKR